MGKSYRVVDLASDKEQFFTTDTASQAVVAAYEQSIGNWNTWTYPKPEDHPEFFRGYLTVACGDFAAYVGHDYGKKALL